MGSRRRVAKRTLKHPCEASRRRLRAKPKTEEALLPRCSSSRLPGTAPSPPLHPDRGSERPSRRPPISRAERPPLRSRSRRISRGPESQPCIAHRLGCVIPLSLLHPIATESASSQAAASNRTQPQASHGSCTERQAATSPSGTRSAARAHARRIPPATRTPHAARPPRA